MSQSMLELVPRYLELLKDGFVGLTAQPFLPSPLHIATPPIHRDTAAISITQNKITKKIRKQEQRKYNG